MITSFRVVLLCGLFGMTVTTFNKIMIHNTKTSIGDITNSCIFGAHLLQMYLFTSEIPQGKKVEIDNSCESFNSSEPVSFVIHGFLANPYGTNISKLISAETQKNSTVFALDWSNAACTNDPIKPPFNWVEYPAAAKNTRKVCNYLVSWINSVIDKCGVPFEKITLMGHSLGADISCCAAKKLFEKDFKKRKISLLILMDPPGVQYMTYNCKKYTERAICLHTSCVGTPVSVADVDLWFNGGYCQPECDSTDNSFDKICLESCMCSHQIAPIYMATLLDNCTYKGVRIPPKGKKELSWLPSFDIPIGKKEFSWLPSFDISEHFWLPWSDNSVSHCPSDRTNCTIINNTILDSNNNLMGDYCVFVSPEYPYCTGDNFSCT